MQNGLLTGSPPGALHLTNPEMYSALVDVQSLLHQRYGKQAQRPMRYSVYPAYTANTGRRVACMRHKDSCNCPGIMCAVTALGDFDYKRGGHLIVFDLKLIIEFPPGATILILSASMDHGNIPIADDEPEKTRTSFTQYASGGLFRHVDFNFKTWKKMTKEERAAVHASDEQRLNDIINML